MTRSLEIENTLIKKYKKTIWNRFVKAIKTYELIKENDRIAVCISGGKDSMLMAKCIQRLQRYSEVPFEAEYIVMDPGYNEKNRNKIIENSDILGIPIKIFESNIFRVVSRTDDNPCYLCSRMRRGFLYNFAQKCGCNKIALGHHFNDVIETILMSVIYGAQFQTMMPKLHSANFEGMELIRPLYMVKEESIISWQNYNKLEFIRCACRLTEKTEAADNPENISKRLEIKKIIAELKSRNPYIETNIFRSVENVNLDTIVSYHKGKDYRSFLDDYDNYIFRQKKEEEK